MEQYLLAECLQYDDEAQGQAIVAANPKDIAVQAELDDYKSMTFNRKQKPEIEQWKKKPQIFWAKHKSRFPLLSRAFRMYAVHAGSSASVERMFSTAGFIQKCKRYRLDPKSMQAIVMQKLWG